MFDETDGHIEFYLSADVGCQDYQIGSAVGLEAQEKLLLRPK
jgi:hypothetical protein